MRLDKRIGLFLSFIGFLTVITLFIRLSLEGNSFIFIIHHLSFSTVFIATIIIFFLTFFTNPRIIIISQIVQVLIFLIFSTIAIYENYSSWYGLGLITVAIMLANKYGFYNRFRYLKIFSTIAYIVVNVEAASYLQQRETVGLWIEALIFLLFFFGIIFLCYIEEFGIYKADIKYLKSAKEILENNISQERSQILKLAEKIKYLENREIPLDLANSNLTSAEMKVLECLVLYNESNIGIGKRLGKSKETVKIQMKSIFDKIGVDNRHQLIRLCKNNFS